MAYEWAIGPFFLVREVRRMWEIRPFFAVVRVLTNHLFKRNPPVTPVHLPCIEGAAAVHW